MNSEVIRMIDISSQVVVAVFSPIILAGIWKVFAIIKKDRVDHSKLKGGLRSMLRSQILQMYEIGLTNQGMTLLQKRTVEELYYDYKNLDGNGFVEDLMCKIHKLDEIAEK